MHDFQYTININICMIKNTCVNVQLYLIIQAPPHSVSECKVLAENHIDFKCNSLDYSSIEVLRCLLLQKTDPVKWNQIMKFESHVEGRRNSAKATENAKYIIDFIRNQCKLNEFDEEIIDKVTGICAVNTFWAHKRCLCNFKLQLLYIKIQSSGL